MSKKPKPMDPEYYDKICTGSLRINRVYSNMEDEYIKIQFKDELSRVLFLEAKMDLESLTKALTGSSADLEFGIRNLDLIGMKRETKHERVMFSSNRTDEEIRENISFLEKDGWKGRDEDAKNHHNHCGGGVYKITFIRWVPANKEQ